MGCCRASIPCVVGVPQQHGVVLHPSSAGTGLVPCSAIACTRLLTVCSGGRSSLDSDGVMELEDEGRTVVGLEVLVMMNCRDSKYQPVTSRWGRGV